MHHHYYHFHYYLFIDSMTDPELCYTYESKLRAMRSRKSEIDEIKKQSLKSNQSKRSNKKKKKKAGTRLSSTSTYSLNNGDSVYFSESDEQINKRAKSAQDHQLIPIVCVGETFQQREMGEAERVIRRQIEQGLEGIEVKRLIVAY